MRHKPILLKKLAKSNKGRFREVIGLIGTHHGTGVTYTGLLLAFYMEEELGKKTAFLECNNHQDFHLIQKAYEWNEEDDTRFSFHQITCYREVSPKGIADILGEDYECLIMDFGTNLAANKEEFLRCTTKIVLGGRSEWDELKLLQFVKDSETIRGSEAWLYFIPQGKDNKILKMKSEIKRRIWTVPEVIEPTCLTHNSKLLFKELFRS